MCRVQGFSEMHGCPKTTGEIQYLGMSRWTCRPCQTTLLYRPVQQAQHRLPTALYPLQTAPRSEKTGAKRIRPRPVLGTAVCLSTELRYCAISLPMTPIGWIQIATPTHGG